MLQDLQIEVTLRRTDEGRIPLHSYLHPQRGQYDDDGGYDDLYLLMLIVILEWLTPRGEDSLVGVR